MLQHLWTGPISNASLDVVKVVDLLRSAQLAYQRAAIDRILGEVVHNKGMQAPIDYVLCIGHFLAKEIYSVYMQIVNTSSSSDCAQPESILKCRKLELDGYLKDEKLI